MNLNLWLWGHMYLVQCNWDTVCSRVQTEGREAKMDQQLGLGIPVQLMRDVSNPFKLILRSSKCSSIAGKCHWCSSIRFHYSHLSPVVRKAVGQCWNWNMKSLRDMQCCSGDGLCTTEYIFLADGVWLQLTSRVNFQMQLLWGVNINAFYPAVFQEWSSFIEAVESDNLLANHTLKRGNLTRFVKHLLER